MKQHYVKLYALLPTLSHVVSSVNAFYLLHQVNSIIPHKASIVNADLKQASQATNIINAASQIVRCAE